MKYMYYIGAHRVKLLVVVACLAAIIVGGLLAVQLGSAIGIFAHSGTYIEVRPELSRNSSSQ